MMAKDRTRQYREYQFSQLGEEHEYNPPKIKIIKTGKTNWLDITELELQAIILLLTK